MEFAVSQTGIVDPPEVNVVPETLLVGLDVAQYEAVIHGEGPLLVVAGPGSGKTRVLVHRVAYLITERKVPANRILMTTFTREAARQMRERLRMLIGPAADWVWLGTVHSRCLKILRGHSKALPEIQLRDGFTVIEDKDVDKLLDGIVRGLLLEKGIPEVYVLQGISTFGLEAMRSRISYAKEWNLEPDAAVQRFRWSVEAGEVYRRYTSALRRTNRIDLADMQMLAVELMAKRPDIIKWAQVQFSYVLVDEYQDTNAIQAKLFKQLCEAHRNITVVGDVDQSIYAFRGASPQFMLDFEQEWPGARTVQLRKNYRSSASIVETSHSVIRHNTKRFDFKPEATLPTGAAPNIVHVHDRSDEADWVLRKATQLHAEGVSWREMTVLYRSHHQLRPIEHVCLHNSVPYRVDGTSFFERREIQDMLAWLALLVNPCDEGAFERAVRSPPCGVGRVTIEKLLAEAQRTGRSIMNLAAQPSGHLRLRQTRELVRLAMLVESFRQERCNPRLLDTIVEQTGYAAFLATEDDGEIRAENVSELCSLFTAFDPPSDVERVATFLDFVATELSLQQNANKDGDAVTLMTMHKAKGTEFDAVFMIGCTDGRIPSYYAVRDKGTEGVEEERRLFYVAMTRARKHLYFIVPAFTESLKRSHTSRFVSEACTSGAKEIEHCSIEDFSR